MIYLAPVVQKVDNAIHQTNHYLLDSSIGSTIIYIHWILIYLADSAIHCFNNWGLVGSAIHLLNNRCQGFIQPCSQGLSSLPPLLLRRKEVEKRDPGNKVGVDHLCFHNVNPCCFSICTRIQLNTDKCLINLVTNSMIDTFRLFNFTHFKIKRISFSC